MLLCARNSRKHSRRRLKRMVARSTAASISVSASLPPTPERDQYFAADTDPRAYETAGGQVARFAALWRRCGRAIGSTLVALQHPQLRQGQAAGQRLADYRDYIIRAPSMRDKPYARFVEEQIAGDARCFPTTATA